MFERSKSLLASVFIVFFLPLGLFSQWSYEKPDWGDALQKPRIKAFIHNEKIRYHHGEALNARVTIINESADGEKLRFLLGANVFDHLELRVVDRQNRALQSSLRWQTYRVGQQGDEVSVDWPELYMANSEKQGRWIELEAGERFSFPVDIGHWVNFEGKTGLFFVDGVFYPMGRKESRNYAYGLDAQRFHVDALVESLDEMRSVDVEKKERESTTSSDLPVNSVLFSPDSVIEAMIRFQKEKDYERYFELFNLEHYLERSYPGTEIFERYAFALAEEKKHLVSEFRDFLIEDMDYNIHHHKIIETRMAGNEARVTVYMNTRTFSEDYVQQLDPLTGQIEFDWVRGNTRDIAEDRLYHFTLLKQNDEWRIVQKDFRLLRGPADIPEAEIETIPEIPFPTREAIELSDILFQRGRFELLPGSFKILNQLVKVLNDYPDMKIEIHGHTDSTGLYNFNVVLSKNRAKAVVDYLTSQGIDLERIHWEGHGPDQPKYDNDDPQKQPLNRRVEFILLPD